MAACTLLFVITGAGFAVLFFFLFRKRPLVKTGDSFHHALKLSELAFTKCHGFSPSSYSFVFSGCAA